MKQEHVIIQVKGFFYLLPTAGCGLMYKSHTYAYTGYRYNGVSCRK